MESVLLAITGMPDVAVGFDDTLVPYEYSLETALGHMEAAGFEVPDIPTITSPSGIGLVVLMSILALAGASQAVPKQTENAEACRRFLLANS